MVQWLISCRLRRIFRHPSGELQESDRTEDKIEFTTDHPAVFLAKSAAALNEFTTDGNDVSSVTTCDRVETIHSVVVINDDVLTAGQQQTLEEAFGEGESEADTDDNPLRQLVEAEDRLCAVLEVLDRVERSIESSERLIADQRARLNRMAAAGLDRNVSRTLLERMLDAQALLEKRRASIMGSLPTNERSMCEHDPGGKVCIGLGEHTTGSATLSAWPSMSTQHRVWRRSRAAAK